MRRIMAATAVLTLLATSVPAAHAVHLHQFDWGAPAYYPGDQASFRMKLFNDYPGVIHVKEILMQWDWQPSGSYYTAPGGQTLIPIQTADYVVNFTVPLNVTIGPHVWTVYYIDANDRQVFVGQGYLQIHDPEERIYLTLEPSVAANITRARRIAFEDPNATALIALANGIYNDATSLADRQDFAGAVVALKNASALVLSAENAETKFQSLKQAYLSDLSRLTAVLEKAQSSNFKSPNATRYLNEAKVEYSRALSLVADLKYAGAEEHLRNATFLIGQANLAEQSLSREGQTSTTDSSTSTQTQQGSESTTRQAPGSSPLQVITVVGALSGALLVGVFVVLATRGKLRST